MMAGLLSMQLCRTLYMYQCKNEWSEGGPLASEMISSIPTSIRGKSSCLLRRAKGRTHDAATERGGVRKDVDLVDGMDLCYILQSFWQNKHFVMVRRDYFRASSLSKNGGTPSLRFVVLEGFESANCEAINANKAERDISLSSSLFELSSSARIVTRLRSVDSCAQAYRMAGCGVTWG